MSNGRCKYHGGKSLHGIAHPRFKHGRYAKHLPARLSEKYEESENDPELLQLRAEIAVTDTRIKELLSILDSGGATASWKELRRCKDEIDEARASGDSERLVSALTDTMKVIDKGARDVDTWEEVNKLIDQRRKLVETEWDRLVKMQQVITVERAMVLLAAVSNIIKTHITDRGILSAVAGDIRKLVQGA